MNDLPISEQKIKELARQAKHCNVAPIFLPNEYFREDNKSPVAALLKDLVPEASDYIAALTDDEFVRLVGSMARGFAFMLDPPERATHEQRERVALYYLGSEIHRIYYAFAETIAADLGASEVLKVYPELVDLLDKDGLLHIDDRFTLHDGGIEYEKHMLHYHQFLRRGFTAQPNFDFLGPFARFYERTKKTNTFRVAIDHLRIMPTEAYVRLMEADRWFGPSFDREKLDNPSAVGLTIMKRNQDSLFGLSNDLDRTEFFWSFRDGVKTLEIEEVSSVGFRIDQYHLNRYLHAERDVTNGVLRHADGAVKIYMNNDYEKRFSSHMPHESKSYKKVKLWRIDGDLDVDVWLELTAFFFKGNEMIIEYFDPATFEAVFEERVRDFAKWKSKQEAHPERG